MGLLKRYPRTGWALAGVPVAESVAEHSFRASVIATVIAATEDADPQRAAFLALWHDTQETRTTDLPHLTRRYVTSASNETVTGDQVRSLPAAFAAMISAAVSEYEACETLKRSVPGTPTSSNAFSRPANTRIRAARTCSAGSSPRSRACAPRPRNSSPVRHSPRTLLSGSGTPAHLTRIEIVPT